MSALLRSVSLRRGGAFAPPPGSPRGGPAVHHDAAWGSTSLSQNVGWRFTATKSVTVTHLRFYSAGNATETVSLYRQSDGALLASASVTTSGGWGETELSTPITLVASADYVVSHYAGGSTRLTRRAPSAIVTDPTLTYVNGVYGASTNMPAAPTATAYVAASFRTAAPATGHRFFRLNVTANNGRSTTNVAELALRATSGGTNKATQTGGWASSTFSGYGAAAAFDGDTSTFWTTAAGVVAGTLGNDLGTGAEIALAEYAVRARHDANDGTPKTWTLEASNDLETWTVLHTVSSETGWANGEQRVFTV